MILLNDKIKLGMVMLVLLVSACKKEDLPPDEIGPTVFGVVGTIDNKAVNIEAGIDNYYMYSSYNYNSSDTIYTFTGQLRRTNCDDSSCVEVLTISIRDDQTRPASVSIDILNSIKVGSYNFRKFPTTTTKPADSIDITVFGDPVGKGPFTHRWSYGSIVLDNATETEMFTAPLSDTSATICYRVIDNSSGIGNQLCNLILIDPDTNCVSNFTYTQVSSDSAIFTPVTPIFSHKWSWGDGSAEQASFGTNQVGHLFPDSTSTFLVTLKSDDGGGAGCRQNINKFVRLNTANDTPLANFTYLIDKRPPVTVVNDSSYFSAVTITWKDNTGITYTSRSDDQPSTSTFEILEVENYPANEKGEPTIKFTARINCRLYNGATFIEMKNAIVKFALSYPG